LVELAAIEDSALVPQAVASTLGVPEQPGRPLTETLVASLSPRAALLLLDNCEHLLTACARLADSLLRACPNLRILATSREGLGIAGESLYPVPALLAPDPERLPSVEDIAQYDAVRLFTERATAVLPAFRITPQNAQSVARICHRLDGIPLAVELAAVRVKSLAVDQISSRLNDRFRLLTGGSRTALPRQQTLRATMDWSYELLSQQEGKLLQRLSAFAGGWTLDAAEAVCSDSDVETRDILDLLTRLIDKSLVMVESQDGEARYHMLETVRQYARDLIVESGREAGVRTRHRDWYLSFAEQADQKRRGTDREGQLDRLEREHDNLRAALEWSRGREESEATLRLAAALGRFWWRRGYWSEGRAWLERALAKESGVSVSVKARALHGAGVLAWVQGDFNRATVLFEESIALSRMIDDKQGIITSLNYLSDMSSSQSQYGRAVALAEECITFCREIGDRETMAEVLNTLGNVALDQGNYHEAAASFEESLMLSRELGVEIEIAFALYHLGALARLRGDYERAAVLLEESLLLGRQLRDEMCIAQTLNTLGLVTAVRGDYRRSAALLEESLALSRRLGDKWSIAISLNHLGLVAWYQGDDRRAATLLTESLALRRQQGYKKGIAASLVSLGNVLRRQGNCEQATILFEESLALCRELEDKEGAAKSLEGLAACAIKQRQLERAARLSGAAQRAREAIGAPLPPPEQYDHDHQVALSRTGLGNAAFTAFWAEGRAMTLEQAIEYALEDTK
jgi:non-specific serine/threonine protein kinase